MSNQIINTKTMNILIIEDEGDISLILNLMLKKEDIELDHVTTIAKAGAFLKDQQPNIVIMDNQLPDGWGMDYIATIKADYPGIKIIMITGNTDITDKETALQNGADVFLAKPFTKDQIQTAIGTVSAMNAA